MSDTALNNPSQKDKIENEQRKNEYQAPGSLLLLQTLLYFDWYYTLMLVFTTFCLSMFKLYALPYPQGYFSIEILILLIYLGLALQRINYGMTGNRIESVKHIFLMIFVSIFCIFCNGYFIAS